MSRPVGVIVSPRSLCIMAFFQSLPPTLAPLSP
ncbi:hypothetical protein IEO21_09833 [Rhodonia placenta]|uniref:Uncharacterized protein n=1 Tax=Rhodonia placenta TaxID=104341 RepID=A0A8H7NTR4_9APHY|nr:hypothetical protein IEO21_09833 [Postia placenta]